MRKEEVDKDDFQELIEKYLDGQTTLEELKLLVNYYESYQQDYTWVEALGSEENTRNRVLIHILEELQNNEANNNKIVPMYKKTIFKYAVAASILILISFTFLFENNEDIDVILNDVELVKTNIEPGTDKATLTLEDGSQIALEKGETFVSKNISSSDKEIIYEKGESKTKEIKYNYLTIPRGGQFSIKLSDGTQVWLNSESELKYPVSFIKGETRQVELVYGEAYFDVSPSKDHNGSKFIVFSNEQEVEVLGTEFNIKAYKDEKNIYTTLVEGKVAVNTGSTSQNLIPGQQLKFDIKNKASIIKKVDVFNETSWKNGVFSFEDKSLKEMMVVLSRWYDVKVVFKNKEIENEEFIGILRKNQTIQEILISIKNLGVIKNFEIYDKKLILE